MFTVLITIWKSVAVDGFWWGWWNLVQTDGRPKEHTSERVVMSSCFCGDKRNVWRHAAAAAMSRLLVEVVSYFEHDTCRNVQSSGFPSLTRWKSQTEFQIHRCVAPLSWSINCVNTLCNISISMFTWAQVCVRQSGDELVLGPDWEQAIRSQCCWTNVNAAFQPVLACFGIMSGLSVAAANS